MRPDESVSSSAASTGLHYLVVQGGSVGSYLLMSSAECGGWSASFFNNRLLSGSPVLQRCDGAVDFGWGMGSPDPAVNVDDFSARWSRVETFAAGSYTFSVTGDDGIRLLVDGNVVIDGWKNQAPTTYTATVPLAAGGESHLVVVEYYEASGGATARASWTRT